MQLAAATLLLAATIIQPVVSTTDPQATYEELSKIPLIYRRAAFREAGTEIQNSLWREHIKSYRDQHPDLPEPKFQLLSDVEAALEHNFGSKKDSIKEKVIEQFGEDEAQKIMAILGPANNETEPSTPDVGGTDDARRRSSKPECNCRVGSGSCIASGAGASCISSTGCGAWWEEVCDAMERT